MFANVKLRFRTSEVSFPGEGEGDGQGVCEQRPVEAKPSEPAVRSSKKCLDLPRFALICLRFEPNLVVARP